MREVAVVVVTVVVRGLVWPSGAWWGVGKLGPRDRSIACGQ